MSRFVVTVAGNTVPPRLGKVIVNTADPEEFMLQGWVASHPGREANLNTMQWRHLEGACKRSNKKK